MMGELLKIPQRVHDGEHPVPMQALEQHIGIIGRTGSRKSYTARGLVEQMLDQGRRVCVIDPTGVWWGLRQLADGSGPSAYKIAIFGGAHGDMPLSERAGPALGRALATQNLPAILDLSEMSKSAQRRFLTGFTEALSEKNRSVLHTPPRGHKFSLAAMLGSDLAGVAIIGRPVSRARQDGFTLEVTRLCTVGHRNACSFLYGAAARATFALGYRRIGTYILVSEPGTSLKAAEWKLIAEVKGRSWNCPSRPRADNHPTDDKLLWELAA